MICNIWAEIYARRGYPAPRVIEGRVLKLLAFACTLLLPWFAAGPAPAQQPLTIEKLISDGWGVAGYVWAGQNRSLILFKHKDYKSFVQCSVLIDVTREQPFVTTCYEVK
jgi:hypothetical protein